MALWPATLPQLGQIGAGYKPQDAVARSRMDVGPPSRRNRSTATTKDVDYQMPLTGVQAAILEDFHENTLRNGALSFDWISPLDGRPVQIAFKSPPEFSARIGDPDPNKRLWVVTLSLEIQPGGSRSGFSPTSLFAASQQGLLYEAFDIGTLSQTISGTTPVTVANDPIGYFGDKSGNDNHATQTTAARPPTYQTGPARAKFDKVDDRLIVTVPTGGFTGTMVLATDQGTASYGVNIPAGLYDIGGRGGLYFPGNAIVGQLIRDGALSAGEKADAEAYFVGNGAMASYGTVVDFANFWRGHSEITEFPLIDTSSGTDFRYAWNRCSSLTSFPLIDPSSGTNFSYAWRACSSLTSFPLIDTSSGTIFYAAWYGCSSLTSFPLLDTSSGTNFNAAWYGCSSLTSFPDNMFDNVKGGDFGRAFIDTALDQTSIDGILVSLVTSGIAAGTRLFDQTGGSAPSVATGQPAIDTLRSRDWTVTVTGGY